MDTTWWTDRRQPTTPTADPVAPRRLLRRKDPVSPPHGPAIPKLLARCAHDSRMAAPRHVAHDQVQQTALACWPASQASVDAECCAAHRLARARAHAGTCTTEPTSRDGCHSTPRPRQRAELPGCADFYLRSAARGHRAAGGGRRPSIIWYLVLYFPSRRREYTYHKAIILPRHSTITSDFVISVELYYGSSLNLGRSY
eukprot:SAG31_NODE_154_length_22184_cov_25.917142_10_plen_199_part_00